METNNEPSFTLTAQGRHGVFDGFQVRRLTPTECMRLQGFPDDWCDLGVNEKGDVYAISDSGKYQCAGNAVTVNVIEALIGEMVVKGCL